MPEAVLDWGGGGGGGEIPKGAHDFFSVGAHQWRSQLFVGMGGGGQGDQMYQQKIKVLVSHIGCAEIFVITFWIGRGGCPPAPPPPHFQHLSDKQKPLLNIEMILKDCIFPISFL